MSAEQWAILVCGICLGGLVTAAEEPAPEAEFLEYLGSWEETDEEWLMHDEWQSADNEEQGDRDRDSEESPEYEDES